MLSGNGRHRRPRQAPAILVTAGVTGSAIAIPLLAAASANAADGTTWDKVAKCESGGAWSADTGNGRYGGLQLTQKQWEKYGGLDYASRADQASRSQQIAVAEKVLAGQGVGVWSTCGLLYGLDKDSGSADVDTGVADGSSSGSQSGQSGSSSDSASGSSGSSGSSNSSDSSSSSGSYQSSDSAGLSDSSTGTSGDSGTGSSQSPSPSADNSANSDTSGSPDSSASAGTQSPDSSPTVSPNTDDSDNSWQIGGSSALVDTGDLSSGRHRGGSADEAATGGAASTSSGRHASRSDDSAQTAHDDTYTVRAGDSLASIADSLDIEGGWRALYAENKKVIGADPSRIVAGQTLEVGS